MGTETFAPWEERGTTYHRLVKLNNPLMGTETR